MRRRLLELIHAPMTDNETWNSCPMCGHTWKDNVPTPRLLHRVRICDKCVAKKIVGVNNEF